MAWNFSRNFPKLLGVINLPVLHDWWWSEPVTSFGVEPPVLPAERLLLPCGGDIVLYGEPRVGLSLSARFRGFFFYCPCQLAAQGYCQLSVRALIFVSYGQVLLVICYLFSFVQAELYLSTN